MVHSPPLPDGSLNGVKSSGTNTGVPPASFTCDRYRSKYGSKITTSSPGEIKDCSDR
jgi:hypothetical protein